MGILVRGARLRIATAIAVLGLGATGCGSDATPTPTETPPSVATPTATTTMASATATPALVEPTAEANSTLGTTPVLPTGPSGPPLNPLDAGGAFSGADIVVSGGAVDLFAYQAVAEGGGSRPAVIVIHENRGLTPAARVLRGGRRSGETVRGGGTSTGSRPGGTCHLDRGGARASQSRRIDHQGMTGSERSSCSLTKDSSYN